MLLQKRTNLHVRSLLFLLQCLGTPKKNHCRLLWHLQRHCCPVTRKDRAAPCSLVPLSRRGAPCVSSASEQTQGAH